jgi:hypothetical protein
VGGNRRGVCGLGSKSFALTKNLTRSCPVNKDIICSLMEGRAVCCAMEYINHHWKKNAFWATAFLKQILPDLSVFPAVSSRITPSGFHFGFRNNSFFYRARSSDLHPTPNLEDQVPVFISPSDKVAQLYPQAPGSLFVAFYVSRGHGGGILTPLHAGSENHALIIWPFQYI